MGFRPKWGWLCTWGWTSAVHSRVWPGANPVTTWEGPWGVSKEAGQATQCDWQGEVGKQGELLKTRAAAGTHGERRAMAEWAEEVGSKNGRLWRWMATHGCWAMRGSSDRGGTTSLAAIRGHSARCWDVLEGKKVECIHLLKQWQVMQPFTLCVRILGPSKCGWSW